MMIPTGLRLMCEAYGAGLRWRKLHSEAVLATVLAAAAERATCKSQQMPLQIAAFVAAVADWDMYPQGDYPEFIYEVSTGEFVLA